MTAPQIAVVMIGAACQASFINFNALVASERNAELADFSLSIFGRTSGPLLS